MQQIALLLPIVLLLGICGPVTQAAENQTAPPATPPQPPALPPNLQTWNDINKTSVEEACLAEAKTEAGGLAWAVQGCACNETQGEGLKRYDCGIYTLQGTVAARITCMLANSTCSLESPYGNGSMTFDQIRQLQAQN